MLDLNLIEQDFRFDTDRKIIIGMQGAKPKRRYTGNELYMYQSIVFDEPHMMRHSIPMRCYSKDIYFMNNEWSMDENASASIMSGTIFDVKKFLS